MSGAISLAGLRREFNERVVLDQVSLELAEERTLAVIGPNGAGKTTLLRILAGLLRPHAGDVRVLGAELPRERWRLRGSVGVLGHDALLYRELTAEENLRFCAELFGLGAAAGARIAELLDAVGMAPRAGSRIEEMSAGMIQRIALCRAILHDPSLLLLDEPLSHLDPGAREALAPLIGPARGRTRVLVTHDPEAGVAGADLVLGLDARGSVAYLGEPAGLGVAERAGIYGSRR